MGGPRGAAFAEYLGKLAADGVIFNRPCDPSAMAAKQPAMSPSGESPAQVLDRAAGPRRAEAEELLALHRELTGAEPLVWAGRIIGFGEHHYRYASGHGGVVPELAFATGPTKHTIYLATGFAKLWPDLLSELGPHRASAACLYLTRLSAVDRDVLRGLLERSLAHTRAAGPAGAAGQASSP